MDIKIVKKIVDKNFFGLFQPIEEVEGDKIFNKNKECTWVKNTSSQIFAEDAYILANKVFLKEDDSLLGDYIKSSFSTADDDNALIFEYRNQNAVLEEYCVVENILYRKSRFWNRPVETNYPLMKLFDRDISNFIYGKIKIENIKKFTNIWD